MRLEDSPWVKLHDPEDVANYFVYFRETASKVDNLLSGSSKNYMSFLIGAQQGTERYNKTTRAHKVTQRNTFRFSEMKERTMTVFIIPDVSRQKAQFPIMEFLQYCFAQEMKRHKNKRS
jgi:type IV secretory pathway TraG/TraD family ATPase VirD4